MTNPRFVISTSFDKDVLSQVVSYESDFDRNTLRSELHRHVIHLQEKQVREVLIKLGWTPPKEGGDESCVPRV